MLDITIGVLGAPGVGKSTFIQRAIGLRTPPLSDVTTRKMALDGVVYNVRLVELITDDVEVDEDNNISWPDYVDEMSMPRVDGAFTLYDVMDHESLGQVPEILNAIVRSAIPCHLVACKCDHHPSHRQINPQLVEQRAKAFIGDVTVSQLSAANPASFKGTFSSLLRSIISLREDRSMSTSSRRRANSSALHHISYSDLPPPQKHARANSEFSAAILRAQAPYGPDLQTPGRMPPRMKSHSESKHHTFLNLEESPGEHDTVDVQPAPPATPTPINPTITDQNTSESGYSFDQLVDRLLAQPISKTDSYFSAVFLALYRHFAAPSQLLDALIKRFFEVEHDKDATLVRTLSQLRYLAILQQWTSRYPEDFSYSITKKKSYEFVSKLSKNRIFAVAAKEILEDLEVEAEDDDAEWALCDTHLRPATSQTFLSTSTIVADVKDDIAHSVDSLTLNSDTQTQSSNRTPSTSTGHSSHSQLNLVEYAAHHARQMVPQPKVTFTKVQWHALMDQPEDTIAKELTRMDWTMFSAIRPRDLIRHVSLNSEQKKKCKSLENVNRMIDHFNHLACWTANFILIRAKPKHRALMLEKFMRIARKLRELNNYNSLVAILSGINSASVHRLAQTRDLIPPAVSKDFLKLEILMGTQRSHFAYRLAWENTSGERVPYLPLHLRDLVSAAQGNKTFTSGLPGPDGNPKINWKKFEIMGEVVLGVQKAQGMPYPNYGRNEEVKSLVLETKIVRDDDELYERSVQLEPSASDRKGKFGWFQRSGTGTSFANLPGLGP